MTKSCLERKGFISVYTFRPLEESQVRNSNMEEPGGRTQCHGGVVLTGYFFSLLTKDHLPRGGITHSEAELGWGDSH